MENLVPIRKEDPQLWPLERVRAKHAQGPGGSWSPQTFEACPMCGALLLHSNRTGVNVCEDACGYIVYPRSEP